MAERRTFVEEVAAKYEGDDCLIWPYGRSGNGYGAVSFGSRQSGAHVFVCELVHGPKPSPLFEVAHGCGNRACCNPKHLRWATRSDNHSDKLLHGTAQRGERHPLAKLTEADVREIRSLKGAMSVSAIAKRFGVNTGTVSEILARKIWAWLE